MMSCRNPSSEPLPRAFRCSSRRATRRAAAPKSRTGRFGLRETQARAVDQNEASRTVSRLFKSPHRRLRHTMRGAGRGAGVTKRRSGNLTQTARSHYSEVERERNRATRTAGGRFNSPQPSRPPKAGHTRIDEPVAHVTRFEPIEASVARRRVPVSKRRGWGPGARLPTPRDGPSDSRPCPSTSPTSPPRLPFRPPSTPGPPGSGPAAGRASSAGRRCGRQRA